jgi:hypothetical protein
MNDTAARQEAIAYDLKNVMHLEPKTVTRKELYGGFFSVLAKVLLIIGGAQWLAFLLCDGLGIAIDYDGLFIGLGIAFIQAFGVIVYLSSYYPLWCSVRTQLKSRGYIEKTLKTLRLFIMGLFFIVSFLCAVLFQEVASSMIVSSIVCMFVCSLLVGMELERAGIQSVFEVLSHWSQNKTRPQPVKERD